VWRKHPPVGELAQDRKMKPGGIDVTVWQHMVDCFNKQLPQVNKSIRESNPRDTGKLVEATTVAALKAKWKKMQREYKATCRYDRSARWNALSEQKVLKRVTCRSVQCYRFRNGSEEG
jgi:hypothetical protein